MKHEPNNPFMRETTQRRSNSAGDLPAEFDRRLVELDRKLSRDAASRPVPKGLAERAYRASVSLLPRRDEHAPLRFPGRMRTPVWGQLAMAASVALAFIVAAWFHSASITAPGPGESYVQHSPPTADAPLLAPERPGALQRETTLTRRAELLSPEALRVLFNDGSDYLFDTRDLTHAEAVDDLYRVYEHLSEL